MAKRPKTKLRCSKCGYKWKEVVYTSSAMSFTPPHCPKCARKGVRSVGKPVKVVPLRKRVKNFARITVGKPLYYGAWVPFKYSVIKPTWLGLRAGWWTLKMKLWAASLPFRALAWGVALPFRAINRLLAPPPKVIVLGDPGRGEGGFVGDSPQAQPRGGFTEPSAPARPESAGFVREGSQCPRCGQNEVFEDGTCLNCEWDKTCVKCPECGDLTFSTEEGECFECGHAGTATTGFAPEDTGSTGFAREDSGRSGFAPEPKPEPTFGATRPGFRG